MKNSKNSTRQLMGIDRITDYSLATGMGELVFFIVSPTNIGVLPESSITERVRSLQAVLSSLGEVEMLALNSWESFEHNKNYYKDRIEAECIPAIRELLRQDMDDLNKKQILLTTAREFYLILRLRGAVETDIVRYLSTVEQSIKSCGFTLHRASREELKRILSVYYEQNVTSEKLEDYDGERWYVPPKTEKPVVAGKKNRRRNPRELEKDFLDMIAPSVIRFSTDHFICGSTYRCVWALREYPTQTEEQALLRHLGEKNGISLHIYARRLSLAEENKVFDNATRKNRLNSLNTNDRRQAVAAEDNLADIDQMSRAMRRSGEPLARCAVFIELIAQSYNDLKQLQVDVQAELIRSKLNVDKLLLRQQQGFDCVRPAGYNRFGSQFERVLPASSVANLYPFNYSGKTDRNGFYIGKDRFGTNILVDFDQRDDDKTSASILILGNSGQGKSYLMKLLMLNILESGKSIISLDAEHEQKEMCEAVGGCFIDLMTGEYRINVLEPKCWSENDEALDALDMDAPETFRKTSILAQHISFLKDFFRAYKDFSDAHIDTIEILLARLYAEWNISEETDFQKLRPEQVPILSDLYQLILREYNDFDAHQTQLYTKQLLQEVLLGLHSMCVGSDAQFFNGRTNISSSRFLVFGVGGLTNVAKNVSSAILFNVLSYMSNKLLSEGNTVAALDELYIWLDNPTAIKYIRNCLKRVRKRNSAMLMASQNLEDFDQPNIREMTKPLFSIPPHQFLFNAGSIDKRSYMDMLQLEEAEYELIKHPHRGTCLYKCGNERYLLDVQAPEYKEKLFGEAGGR